MSTDPVEGKAIADKSSVDNITPPPAAGTKTPVGVPGGKPSSVADTAPLTDKKSAWRRWTALAVVVLMLISGAFIALRFMDRALPDGLIQANGRIEGDRVSVAGKFPGRIAKLLVREGDSVTPGQVLAVFDDAQAQAKVSQARAAVAALAAQLHAAETSLEVLKQDVQLGIDIAGAGVDNANAVLDKATAAKQQAAHDARRYRELLASGTIDKHKSEIANLAASASGSEQEAAGTGLKRAEKQLDQAELGDERVRAKNDGLAALAAQLEQGHAVLAEAESILGDMTLCAPIGGVITTRVRDKGEVVAAGSPLFDLVDLDRLYLKVYVPESQIGMLRLLLPARIYTDAFPDKPFPATARYIASRAEFTPKEVQTPDERVKLVYAVKLYLDENPDHSLTPGLPADAVIRWQDGVEWQKPKW